MSTSRHRLHEQALRQFATTRATSLLIIGYTGCEEYENAVNEAAKARVPHEVRELPNRLAFLRFLKRPEVQRVVDAQVNPKHTSSVIDENRELSIHCTHNIPRFVTVNDPCSPLWRDESLGVNRELTPTQAGSKKTKKIIVVIGATGAQGGGLAKALLTNGVYAVRGVTRNPNSEKARALTALGVDVVTANLDDVESLKRAFKGAYGAYFLTSYWEHMNPEIEIQQMKNLAHAARAAGIQHAVVSTLEDTRQIVKKGTMPTLHGDMYVPHFDGKGGITDYISKTVPTTAYYTSCYYENFINFGMGPKPDDKGDLTLTFPLDDVPFPTISVEDIGVFAAKIFEHPELIGKSVGVAAQNQTVSQMAATFSKVLGQPVKYKSVPPEVYAELPMEGITPQGVKDLANMFQFMRDYPDTFNKMRDLEAVKKIVPGGLTQFETWLRENKNAFVTGVGG